MLRELALSLGSRNLESDLRGGLRSRLFRVAAAELPMQWPWGGGGVEGGSSAANNGINTTVLSPVTSMVLPFFSTSCSTLGATQYLHP